MRAPTQRLSLALLVLVLSACGDNSGPTAPPDTTAERRTITIGIQQEPDNLHPLFQEMSASIEVGGDTLRSGPLSAGLTVRGADWVLRPWMAVEIPSAANGQWRVDLEKKTMTTTWHIKPEACWEDGTPVTAKDFIFAWKVKMDPNVPVVDNSMEKRIASMRGEGEDQKTLVVEWNALYATADEGLVCLPSHVEQKVYDQDPGKYKESPHGRKPLSNGPFRLAEWAPGSHLVLERNPKWWGPSVQLDRIIFKIIGDTNTMLANLQAGQLDAISPVGISFDQALELDKNPVAGFRVVFTPGLVWEHVDFNLDNKIVGDKRVRQALQYATDREKIVGEYFGGRQEAAHSWLPPKHYAHHPDLKKYGYDPKKAAALLAEAGWKRGADGTCVNDQGERLTLTIMSTAGNKVRENIEQILQAQWKRVGVELVIQNQEANVFFGVTMRERKFPHLAMYAWSMSPTADGENLWTIENIPSAASNWVGQNTPGWRHAEANELDHRVPTTMDKDERIRLLRREQEIWVEELPTLLLYFRTETTVVRNELQGWQPTGTDVGVSWNCHEWHFAK